MRTKAIAFICVFLTLLGNAVLLPGRVLCIGEDGHVQLEPARGGVCIDPCSADGSDSAEPSNLTRSSGSQCGACTDVPLESGLLHGRIAVPKRPSDELRVVVNYIYFADLDLPLFANAPKHSFLTFESHFRGFPPFLETTVLLI